jgi:hypothetical protein
MPLELPEDRDRAGIARLIQRVRSESEDAHSANGRCSTSTWPGGNSRRVPSTTRCRSSTRLLELFASSRLVAVWTNYQPFIQAERERYGDPGLYEELEHVASRWTAGTTGEA